MSEAFETEAQEIHAEVLKQLEAAKAGGSATTDYDPFQTIRQLIQMAGLMNKALRATKEEVASLKRELAEKESKDADMS